MAKRKRRVLRVGLWVLGVLVVSATFIVYRLSPGPIRMAAPIRIENGMLQGFTQAGMTIYEGIPYAAPPIGDRRWRAPRAVANWTGTLQATAFKPVCMQQGPSVPGMEVEPKSEDCLYLNVWTPAKAENGKLAVMVFLYGGGDSHGSGSARLYRGDQIAKRGVIVVTFNYRVLSFGSLAHPELTKESGYNASGNYALLDDVAALKWVQSNIAAFGGDPGNVTLFGQSGGAYQESKLSVSPLARGLFKRVVAESGGDFTPAGTSAGFPLLAQAEQTGVSYVEQFGVHSIADMRKIPADKIVDQDNRTQTSGGVTGINRLNVDGYVIPGDVYTLYAEGKHADVDLLVGYNADEGSTQMGPPLKATDYVASVRGKYGALADRFLALYPGGSDQEAARSQARIWTEDSFAWEDITWARLHVHTSTKKVFFYYFSRVPPFGQYKRLSVAGHGAELPYVFGFLPGPLFLIVEAPWNAYRDIRLENDIQTYWTNFAKTGDPNGKGLPEWPAFTANGERVLELGKTIEARDLPAKPEHALMDAYMAALRSAEPH